MIEILLGVIVVLLLFIGYRLTEIARNQVVAGDLFVKALNEVLKGIREDRP